MPRGQRLMRSTENSAQARRGDGERPRWRGVTPVCASCSSRFVTGRLTMVMGVLATASSERSACSSGCAASAQVWPQTTRASKRSSLSSAAAVASPRAAGLSSSSTCRSTSRPLLRGLKQIAQGLRTPVGGMDKAAEQGPRAAERHLFGQAHAMPRSSYRCRGIS